MPNENGREKLLLQMYDQHFNDINRHIMVVWQSIGVLIGAFTILALVEKNIISLDTGATLILLICCWLIANVIDSSYWYNRNIVIIANIERQFLQEDDLREIHYYFGKHRPNKMITHLRIQAALGTMLAIVVSVFHFIRRVAPGFNSPITNIEVERALPYLILILSIVYLVWLKGHRDRSYGELIKNSPGKKINTTGITYGEGHGFGRTKLQAKASTENTNPSSPGNVV